MQFLHVAGVRTVAGLAISCTCVCVCVRARARETERHTYIHTYIHTHRETDRQTDRQTNRQTEWKGWGGRGGLGRGGGKRNRYGESGTDRAGANQGGGASPAGPRQLGGSRVDPGGGRYSRPTACVWVSNRGYGPWIERLGGRGRKETAVFGGKGERGMDGKCKGG